MYAYIIPFKPIQWTVDRNVVNATVNYLDILQNRHLSLNQFECRSPDSLTNSRLNNYDLSNTDRHTFQM